MVLNAFSHPSSPFAAPLVHGAASEQAPAPILAVAVAALPESSLEIAPDVQLPASDEFHDGFHSGWLEYDFHYKDTPITGSTITNFLFTNMHDPSASALWNAGYCTGWLARVFCPDSSLQASRPGETPVQAPGRTVDAVGVGDVGGVAGRSLDLGEHQVVLSDDGSLELLFWAPLTASEKATGVHLSAEESYRLFVSLQAQFPSQ